MKTQSLKMILLVMTTVLFSACENTKPNEKSNQSAEKNEQHESAQSSKSLIPVYGKVLDMNGNPLQGVKLRQGNAIADVTDSSGNFNISIDENVEISKNVNYSLKDMVQVNHIYERINHLKGLIVYMESETTPPVADKRINGIVKAERNKGGDPDPLPGVVIKEHNNRSNKGTCNTIGYFTLNCSGNPQGFEFEFPITESSGDYIIIKNIKDIKDSTKLDIVLSSIANPYDFVPN